MPVSLRFLPSAEHAPHLPLHGPRAGHEHVPAALAVPVGVLHGDRLRLVGHPAPRPAQHGAEPGGEVARGVHAPERGPAAGQWVGALGSLPEWAQGELRELEGRAASASPQDTGGSAWLCSLSAQLGQ